MLIKKTMILSCIKAVHALNSQTFMEGFPGGSEVKVYAHNAGDPGSIPGWKDPLEKEMATHSSTLA